MRECNKWILKTFARMHNAQNKCVTENTFANENGEWLCKENGGKNMFQMEWMFRVYVMKMAHKSKVINVYYCIDEQCKIHFKNTYVLHKGVAIYSSHLAKFSPFWDCK